DRDLLQCLPPLVEPGTTFSIVPTIADALGLSHAVRIAVGGGDNMMAAIGTGCVVPDRLSMSLGTSGTLFAYADRPVVDANGSWAAFCSSSGGWLPLICTMNCTVATETIARLFDFSVGQGEAMIGATSPGA
ncbi:xylulokinase, partial [Lysobacter sp. 2RAB21]